MDIRGKTRIFKNDKGFYSTSVSRKKEDGTYKNMYMSVNFKKGIEVENNTEIDVKKGFISFYEKDERLIPVLVVTEFETINKEEKSEFSTISESDLPF